MSDGWTPRLRPEIPPRGGVEASPAPAGDVLSELCRLHDSMRIMHKRLMQGMDETTGRLVQVEGRLEQTLNRFDDLLARLEAVDGSVARAAGALERAAELLAAEVVPALEAAVAGLERQGS